MKSELMRFKLRDKFSDESWKERGLNPSEVELSKKMSLLFNDITDELIKLTDRNLSEKQFKAVLKRSLQLFHKSEYDTEEKEFICELFTELAGIVKVDINKELNIWLYGRLSVSAQKLLDLLNSERIIETIGQPCTKCNVTLETHIKIQQEGIPDHCWFVAKCDNCGEFNMLSLRPEIKELKIGNYKLIEMLNKDQYNYDQALSRLEQIKLEKSQG